MFIGYRIKPLIPRVCLYGMLAGGTGEAGKHRMHNSGVKMKGRNAYEYHKRERKAGSVLLTWRPSLLHRPLLVLVGAMVTTGGVFGTLWPAGGTRTGPGPRGPLLGVLTGELWLVAGEDTGEDSLLMEDAAVGGKRRRGGGVLLAT